MISAVPNRFKYRQKSQFTVFFFFFLCRSKSFQRPLECSLYCPCFQNYLCNSKLFQIPSESTNYCSSFQIFQEAILVHMLPSCFDTKYVKKILIAVSNIISECVIMHAKTSLFENDLCSPKSFQIPPEITIYRLLFLFFSL